MIAEIFAYSTLTALLIGLAATGVERLLGELKLPRRLAWLGAYGAALLLPTLSLLWRAETPAAAATGGAAASSLASGESSIDWNITLAVLWVAATAILLLCYLAASLRLSLLARRWPSVASDAGIALIADDVGPAVLGIARPRVVLPRWLLHAPASLRKTVMAHELEHVAARDPLLLTGAHLMTILLPWNLPLWWFGRRLRTAIELDCDSRVLQAGVNPSHYGEVLLAVSERRAFVPSFGAALTEPATQLERRIRIMLARDQPASIRRAAGAALFALAIAACATTVAPPPARPPVASSNDATGASRFFSGGIEEIVSVGDYGAANRIVRSPDGTMTLHSPALVLHLTDGTQLRGSSGGIVKSPTSMVFEGNVKLDFGGTSVTATRAVATQTADGRMTVTVENAVVVRPPE